MDEQDVVGPPFGAAFLLAFSTRADYQIVIPAKHVPAKARSGNPERLSACAY